MFTSLLYAQDSIPKDPNPGSGIMGFLPIIIMFVILYFLLIRPQQKKQKDMVKMRDDLQKNEKVITSGGIIGTIYSIKGDVIVLKVDDNVKIEVTKSAIATKFINQ
ncbi:MAG: preprotein translocase subunit YajC [Candidatus Celaenobacter polaris]|nr:preprotein translocase subunit YajC [Candidatus Celaenobacter polaris]